MSTKTTFKRVALVTVAALGFGLLSSVTPASAVATGLVASVGPNGQTSLTVVGGDSGTAGALIRLDVTNNDTTTITGGGLGVNETITGSVSVAPALRNAGSMADTTTPVGLTGTAARSDFVMLETNGQTQGTRAATTATSVSRPTNWALLASMGTGSTGWTVASNLLLDTATAGMSPARASDAKIDSPTAGFNNMDSIHENTSFEYTKSYYVTVRPRLNSDVMDKGAYTFSFVLTDKDGVVRSTATVKIDFVSSAAVSGAIVGVSTNGTFLANTALTTYDTSTNAYVKATLTNRDGGLIRTNTGGRVAPTVVQQSATTLAPTYVDSSAAVTLADDGAYGADFGSNSLTSPGNGTNRADDGVYGVVTQTGAASSATTGLAYRMWAAYGNATIATAAFTVYAQSGSGTASAGNTDVLVTAAGMSAADQLLISGTAATAKTSNTWTVPTTTKTATLKFWIQTSNDTATPAADITVKPSWSGTYGTASVSPVTSTTGTVYTTDALGNFSVTVTNDAPVAGASVALVLSGGTAFGAGTYTATLTWATPAAATIAIADPLSGVYVKTASTNVTTVIVKDQFGNPVSGQGVSVSVATTPAPAVASTTVISPITTGATGTATYSLTGGAASTAETITFACVPIACTTTATAGMTYNYVATVPAVATMVAYHGTSHATAGTTLTPATGIYQTGTTTELVLRSNRDLSRSLTSFADSAADDMINLRFYALAAGSVAATGAVVTVTAGDGGHILDASGLPVKTRNFLVTSTGYTAGIQVLATKTGAITFTATSGTVTSTAAIWVANATADARNVKITSAATGTANGTGTPVTVTVTDRYGNPVSGVNLNVVASGVGSFMGGNITQSFQTDSSGTYTFLANTTVSEGGVAKFTATSGNSGTSMADAAGYVGTTAVDATLAAGNSSASTSITFAAGSSATDVAQTATDAAAEATDAANAATDAANAAAEAADAATAAAQDAADAVAALSTQVSEMVNALKKQITALTNLVIKIQKKVKA
jgi:hypothetical protein